MIALSYGVLKSHRVVKLFPVAVYSFKDQSKMVDPFLT